jgi:hypothetical protein
MVSTTNVFLLSIFISFKISTGFDVNEYEKLILKIAEDQFLIAEYGKLIHDLNISEPDYFSYNPFKHGTKAFDCPVIPPSPSEVLSVHKLRPSDIKVVGALGDSITAGKLGCPIK